LVELAKELALALIETGYVLPDNVQETLEKTHATLSALKAQEEMGTTITVPVSETQPVDWRKRITRHAVICLECGQSFKQLSRHLRLHGLYDRSYRTKHGIPHAQPLSARATTARRRQVVQET
jgi:predicted transcriptional regulator